MKYIHFSCKLLSDLIINQKSATEGNQATLDFIPGNNFLGITAGQIYNKLSAQEQILLFHSGKVRFGDAHPSINNKRSLRAPSVMYYPKLKKSSDICYIYSAYNRDNDPEKLQLKQCRGGFYIFDKEVGIAVDINKSFAIKSAYDRNERRSKDKQMYGYQSIEKGLEFIFEIAVNDEVSDELLTQIKASLTGIKRIGRSRTAQYGLVEISESNTSQEQNSSPDTISDHYIYVYADGRLIFLDQNGLPTFTPNASDLGVDEGEIDWSKSQIRTFSYAPWNFKRQARDADGCGIEKGSVIVIKTENKPFLAYGYVGKYQNEGFGKIIYNPWFLKSIQNTNGKAFCTLLEAEKSKGEVIKDFKPKTQDPAAILVLNYLKLREKEAKTQEEVYQMVNDFTNQNADLFSSHAFASQWGSIRSLAHQYPKIEDLRNELFEKKIQKYGKQIDFAYLTHGIAKEKWAERNRMKKFKEFFDKLTDENVQFAIVNLAAEMAKKCGRKK